MLDANVSIIFLDHDRAAEHEVHAKNFGDGIAAVAKGIAV